MTLTLHWARRGQGSETARCPACEVLPPLPLAGRTLGSTANLAVALCLSLPGELGAGCLLSPGGHGTHLPFTPMIGSLGGVVPLYLPPSAGQHEHARSRTDANLRTAAGTDDTRPC